MYVAQRLVRGKLLKDSVCCNVFGILCEIYCRTSKLIDAGFTLTFDVIEVTGEQYRRTSRSNSDAIIGINALTLAICQRCSIGASDAG